MEVVTEKNTRICSACLRDLPLREFRFRNRARGTRHSACRECRVQRDRWARTKHRKRLTKRELTALRRACSTELLANLVDSLICRLGGVENLVSMWLGLITEGQSTATRIKALETLLHTMGVADSAEFGEEVFELANSPQEMALHWQCPFGKRA